MLSGMITSVHQPVNTSGANLTVDSAATFDSDSDKNIAIGSGTMVGVLDGADDNIAIGRDSLAAITTADQNIGIGTDALGGITVATNNIGIGFRAGDTMGSFANADNVFIGSHSGGGAWVNNASSHNIGIGSSALSGAMDNSHRNIAIGYQAGENISAGDDNIFIGYQTGDGLAGQSGHTIIGSSSLSHNSAQVNYCTALGNGTLQGNLTTGANYTVAVGSNALQALTTGAGNIGIGYNAMQVHTTGSRNIAIGYGSMDGTQGADPVGSPQATSAGSVDNIFIGKDSGGGLWANAVSSYNVGIGTGVMDAAMNGATRNTGMGYGALGGMTSGDDNTAIGATAGNAISSGLSNTFLGSGAGDGISTTHYNTAVGTAALSVVGGTGNTAIGYVALASNDASYSTAVGYAAMYTSATVANGVAIGSSALYTANTDVANGTVCIGSNAGGVYAPVDSAGDGSLAYTGGTTLIGYNCGNDIGSVSHGLTTGTQNTAVGHESLGANANAALIGDHNTVMGYRAGYGLNGAADNNTFIGSKSGDGITAGSNNTALGQLSLSAAGVIGTCTAIGTGALKLSTGASNVSVGYLAGAVIVAGLSNTHIGTLADGAAAEDFQVSLGKSAVTQNSYEARLGAYGGFQFMSGEFEATATDATEFTAAGTAYLFKIPAFAYIKSISATCLVLHGDSTADFMIVRSVDASNAEGALLSEGTSGWLELLGGGADGTVNTGNLSSGEAHDLEAGSGTGNLNQVWYNEKVLNLNTANHATETAASYIWLLNAGTGNADANHATKAKWRVCIEFIGQG